MTASWCSSPTLPPAQQLPQRPLRSLIMAALQQQHEQHITAHAPPPLSQTKTKSSTTRKQKIPLLRNQPQSKITQTNSLFKFNVCRLVFFSNAAASAAAPAAPTFVPDHGGASAATQTTHLSARPSAPPTKRQNHPQQ